MSDTNDPNPNRAPWASSSSGADDFGTPVTPAPYVSPGSGPQNTNEKKRGLGCWVWGCLGTIVFMLIAIIGIGFATYFFWNAQIDKYTDTQPAELPVVEMDADELKTLENRIESFTSQVRNKAEPAVHAESATAESGGADKTNESGAADQSAAEHANTADERATAPPARELVLTAKEINALIAANPDLRGHVFIKIKDGAVSGQVSFPTDMIPGASGRFFNADAQFDVSLQDGVLVVRLTDARVKGERIPQHLLDGLSRENLAKDLYKDSENAEMLRKFESIEVLDDSIVLRLKEPKTAPQSESTDR